MSYVGFSDSSGCGESTAMALSSVAGVETAGAPLDFLFGGILTCILCNHSLVVLVLVMPSNCIVKVEFIPHSAIASLVPEERPRLIASCRARRRDVSPKRRNCINMDDDEDLGDVFRIPNLYGAPSSIFETEISSSLLFSDLKLAGSSSLSSSGTQQLTLHRHRGNRSGRGWTFTQRARFLQHSRVITCNS